ncbi:TPA: T3SS2 effector GTPase-activating deamidase VopC [Vibrio parahaemolyticus]|uniref:T3SS2 effector GTPase-activating deamidase VopC n=1 Tax=Vibrio parahaemolyticus TaxID=670 RepID=UPI000426A728|nr:T3SS2 effector GTPase-activating deamidase VopC [Vibrio parahaemolyticus]WKX43469.1 T3SS2 effector GTPase-activating deamidase VopC [Vibrio parahaemolyticus]HCE2735448.1 T3SS2 effector GTPase-activating deamidase VopC [Vibrio parahaemolyticus]HCE2740897.1 T3SS2 effector GTPase-activating deamidase VopC [Vibrio parahaemolyticus]HCE2751511.1 T3SS2 effector GTPase-activating deamidase VopC [Vibrio parahaemolyticus]HCE2855007.1 T3SS2 effector GTPase-activating deamidase VopC [Vibrio parahaemoly
MPILNISKFSNTEYAFVNNRKLKEPCIKVKSVRTSREGGEILFINMPSKSKYKDLRAMVKSSVVVSESNQTAASKFENNSRFNRNDINVKKADAKSITALKSGDLHILKGKGIIGMKGGDNKLPFKCTIVNDDKNGAHLSQGTNLATNGIKSMAGDSVRAAQLIPGTPLGQFYNSAPLDDSFNVVHLPNGQRGVNGLKIPLSEFYSEKNFLFSNGALSGCMTCTAIDKNNLYIFHVGKDGNDTSPWKTNVDGSSLIQKNMKMLLGQNSDSLNNGIQGLIDYCSKNFDKAIIQYCGHGEQYSGRKNIHLFDYNTPQKNNPLRVGNNLTLISHSDNGSLSISTLCDDMIINSKTCETNSVNSKLVLLKNG